MTNFVKERNEALLSGDEEKIIAYCKKYGINIPENKEVFWAGIHKSICNLYVYGNNSITLEQYNKSYEWLAKHGYSASIM